MAAFDSSLYWTAGIPRAAHFWGHMFGWRLETLEINSHSAVSQSSMWASVVTAVISGAIILRSFSPSLIDLALPRHPDTPTAPRENPQNPHPSPAFLCHKTGHDLTGTFDARSEVWALSPLEVDQLKCGLGANLGAAGNHYTIQERFGSTGMISSTRPSVVSVEQMQLVGVKRSIAKTIKG